MKQDYEVLVDGWLDGTYRKESDVVSMSERQAKYHILAGKVRPFEAPKPAPRRAKKETLPPVETKADD